LDAAAGFQEGGLVNNTAGRAAVFLIFQTPRKCYTCFIALLDQHQQQQ